MLVSLRAGSQGANDRIFQLLVNLSDGTRILLLAAQADRKGLGGIACRRHEELYGEHRLPLSLVHEPQVTEVARERCDVLRLYAQFLMNDFRVLGAHMVDDELVD